MVYFVKKSLVQLRTLNATVESIKVLGIEVLFVTGVELKLLLRKLEEIVWAISL